MVAISARPRPRAPGPRSSPPASAGSVMRMSAPWPPRCTSGESSSSMRPPCSSMILVTMARPRPVPFSRVVMYGSSSRWRFSAGNPMPVSMTSTTMLSSSSFGRDRDLRTCALLRRQRGNGFGGVLHDVGEGLGDQACVEAADERLVRQFDLEVDVRMGDLDQEHRLADRLGQVPDLERRLRHAREGRELVDHAADVADLADDRVGALVEDLAVVVDRLAELAPEPFGRKLDRRQRILDLVGDAPRHVRPGGASLGCDQVGDVVERDDVAMLAVGGALRRHPHVDGALAAATIDGDLVAMFLPVVTERRADHRPKLRQDFGDRPPLDRPLAERRGAASRCGWRW